MIAIHRMILEFLFKYDEVQAIWGSFVLFIWIEEIMQYSSLWKHVIHSNIRWNYWKMHWYYHYRKIIVSYSMEFEVAYVYLIITHAQLWWQNIFFCSVFFSSSLIQVQLIIQRNFRLVVVHYSISDLFHKFACVEWISMISVERNQIICLFIQQEIISEFR